MERGAFFGLFPSGGWPLAPIDFLPTYHDMGRLRFYRYLKDAGRLTDWPGEMHPVGQTTRRPL